ncbi:LAFE_0C04104g1_1 [Lachancea fermentati]|uniref:LAFE_0C04104g1_1 n=1 Tax=Lachancea fermentati TaxID=4955 RepID=A0A1G4M9K3_LACFM|nr:LAFE_0C04104g1_1 [Lachancea fermentati]
MTEGNEYSSNDLLLQSSKNHSDFPCLSSADVGYIDDMDDDTFELPLKARFAQASNFSELETYPSASSFEKRVRFEGQPNEAQLTISKMNTHDHRDAEASSDACESKSAPNSTCASRKPHVEELIQHAHNLNRYLDQNMDKIKTFRSKLLNSGPYDDENNNIVSNAATAPTTTSGSVSNFQLSDSDQSDFLDDEPEMHDRRVVKLQTYDENEDHKIKDILSKHQPATFSLSENLSSMDLDRDNAGESENNSGNVSVCTSMGSFSKDMHTLLNSPSLGKNRDLLRERPSTFEERRSTSLLTPEDDTEVPDLNSEAALTLFSNTISILLKMAESVPEDEKVGLPAYVTFIMKAPPTLIYEHYLERIQTKFCFAPIVYLTATYLLECLILTRRDHELQLKFPLRLEQVHRLIIASIRLATKLLEDCVHSHAYFSKVCGISKKLLTKLEVALLECLNYEGLKITNSNLTMAVKVHEELCAMAK